MTTAAPGADFAGIVAKSQIAVPIETSPSPPATYSTARHVDRLEHASLATEAATAPFSRLRFPASAAAQASSRLPNPRT